MKILPIGNLVKTKPIQSQFKPNQTQYKPKTNPKQTQTNPIFTKNPEKLAHLTDYFFLDQPQKTLYHNA